MTDIRGDTWATLDIVEGKLADAGVQLEEERQRLANSTTCAEHDDLGQLEWHFSLGGEALNGDSGELTSAAVAEKALRWAAAPKTDCDTFLAANMMTVEEMEYRCFEVLVVFACKCFEVESLVERKLWPRAEGRRQAQQTS